MKYKRNPIERSETRSHPLQSQVNGTWKTELKIHQNNKKQLIINKKVEFTVGIAKKTWYNRMKSKRNPIQRSETRSHPVPLSEANRTWKTEPNNQKQRIIKKKAELTVGKGDRFFF